MQTGFRRVGTSVAAIASLADLSLPARADDTVFSVMMQKCQAERQLYCSNVSAKETRVAACLYAHEDKSSAECAVAIYDAMLALQVTIGNIGGYVRLCRADMLKFCGSVKPGEGRLYACLAENETALSGDCRSVLGPAKQELQNMGIAK